MDVKVKGFGSRIGDKGGEQVGEGKGDDGREKASWPTPRCKEGRDDMLCKLAATVEAARNGSPVPTCVPRGGVEVVASKWSPPHAMPSSLLARNSVLQISAM